MGGRVQRGEGPMDEKTALHTAARRCCMRHVVQLDPQQRDRDYQDWSWRDLEVRQPAAAADAEAGALFAMFWDVLFAIEQVTPHDFGTVNELRAFLIAVGQGAGHDAFCAYIAALTPQDLHLVPPLPYRRVLQPRERDRAWTRLGRRWGPHPDACWYPLTDAPAPPGVVAVRGGQFARHVPLAVLRAILTGSRVRRVWELRYGDIPLQYEMDTALLIPSHGPTEGYWTSEKMDWILYALHEGSLTIGGEWLLNGVKKAWPQWEQHLQTSHIYKYADD